MRILLLSSQALFRDTRFGGAKRLYYLARGLESIAELRIVCLDGCNEFPGGKTFPQEFRQILFLPSGRPISPVERVGFLPDAAATVHAHRDKVAAFIGRDRFDAVLLAFPAALHFLDSGLVPAAGRVVYLEDDLLFEQFRQFADAEPAFLRRQVKRWRLRQALAFYRKVLRNVSAFACISSQEADIVRAQHPNLPVALLGYGLPLAEYPVLPFRDGPLTLGFIGNYRHAPNKDAAQWLVRELFPAVLHKYPDARLVLCGTGIPEEILKDSEGNRAIRILENISDLPEFYGEIGMFINPLREGRGMRTKVVEAAAFGRPVLSTKLGAEGLSDLNISLFEDGESLLGAIAELEGEAGIQAARHNRAVVESTFSMDKVGGDLLRVLKG